MHLHETHLNNMQFSVQHRVVALEQTQVVCLVEYVALFGLSRREQASI